jgi:hypothetical protein
MLGTTDDILVSLDRYLWDESKKLNNESSLILEQLISLEEIKRVVFECNEHKAPGSNGISFLFFIKYTDL